MGKSSAPQPPDPRQTSQAQTGTSIATAIANMFLNNMNQYGPEGSKTFSNNGFYNFTDPYTHQTYKIPMRSQTTSLSPEQQKIFDQNNKTKFNLATLAKNQSAFLNSYMAKPFNGSNGATEARLLELGRKRLDPALADRTAALETQLSNQGIKSGSEAYSRAMEANSKSSNDAYDNLILSGHGQAFQEGQAIRNQPINEIISLLSGSQVNQPQFGGFYQNNIPTTDNAGLINTNYNQRFGAWQQNQQNAQSLLGGLFGFGANMLKFSDRRVKKDIIRLARMAAGYCKYTFRYLWDGDDAPYCTGYMAQEVQQFVPEAVGERCGILTLDYAMLEAV